MRKMLFTQRVINFRKSLTSFVVNASSIPSFKANLDNYLINQAHYKREITVSK